MTGHSPTLLVMTDDIFMPTVGGRETYQVRGNYVQTPHTSMRARITNINCHLFFKDNDCGRTFHEFYESVKPALHKLPEVLETRYRDELWAREPTRRYRMRLERGRIRSFNNSLMIQVHFPETLDKAHIKMTSGGTIQLIGLRSGELAQRLCDWLYDNVLEHWYAPDKFCPKDYYVVARPAMYQPRIVMINATFKLPREPDRLHCFMEQMSRAYRELGIEHTGWGLPDREDLVQYLHVRHGDIGRQGTFIVYSRGSINVCASSVEHLETMLWQWDTAWHRLTCQKTLDLTDSCRCYWCQQRVEQLARASVALDELALLLGSSPSEEPPSSSSYSPAIRQPLPPSSPHLCGGASESFFRSSLHFVVRSS